MSAVILSLLTISLAQAPRASDPEVLSASQVATRLGAQANRTVSVEPALRRIPLLVDAGSLSPIATLRTIAFALHATLVPEGNALRIMRTTADRAALEVAHASANRARMEGGLGRWDRILRQATTYGDEAAQVAEARKQVAQALRESKEAFEARRPYTVSPNLMGENMVTPAGRLLRGLLGRLGPERLASPSLGEVRFFSDRPGPGELPLPACGDLLDAYARAQSRLAAATGMSISEARPTKTIVRIHASGAGVDLYDAMGRRIDRGSMRYDMSPIVVPTVPAIDPRDAASWRELGEPSRELAAFLSGKPIGKPQAPALEHYLHPERFDPLGFSVRTGISNLPRPGSRALIAVLSDDLLAIADECTRDGRLDASLFERRVLGPGVFESVAHAGATLVRPIDEAMSESTLADREALGRELRRVVQEGEIGLRTWCALRGALHTGFDQPATERYLRALPRLVARTFETLRLDKTNEYALVGAALQSDAFKMNGSPPRSRSMLMDGLVRGWLRFEPAPGVSDLDLAPSTLIGRLSEASVAPTVAEVPIAQPYGGEPGSHFEGLDAESVGSQAARLSALSSPGRLTEERLRSFILRSRYRFGRRLTLGADVSIGGLIARIRLEDEIEERRGLTFEDLPRPFQERVFSSVRNGPAEPFHTRGIPPRSP